MNVHDVPEGSDQSYLERLLALQAEHRLNAQSVYMAANHNRPIPLNRMQIIGLLNRRVDRIERAVYEHLVSVLEHYEGSLKLRSQLGKKRVNLDEKFDGDLTYRQALKGLFPPGKQIRAKTAREINIKYPDLDISSVSLRRALDPRDDIRTMERGVVAELYFSSISRRPLQREAHDCSPAP